MRSLITIVIPLDSKISLDPYKDCNIKKNIKVIVIKGKNPSKNRNIGIKKVKTNLVAFINGHTILSNNWHKQVEKFFFEHPEIDVVGGPQHNYEQDNLFAKASGYATGSIFGAGGASKRYSGRKLNLNADESAITSANLICKKNIFKKIKFDESIYPGEDPKFIKGAKKAGFKVAYSPDIVAYNKRRNHPIALARQIFNYGKVRPRLENLTETLRRPYFVVPSLFILYLIMLPILYLLSYAFIYPLFVYAILNILFSFYEGIKNKRISAIALLPFIFVVIHLSYGIGLIYGLFSKK